MRRRILRRLIWVYAVCLDLSVRLYTDITVTQEYRTNESTNRKKEKSNWAGNNRKQSGQLKGVDTMLNLQQLEYTSEYQIRNEKQWNLN